MIPAFVNPDAGTADRAQALLSADPRFCVHSVGPVELLDSIRREVDGGAPRILVAGGDGTIAAAASVVAGTDRALAVLPGGTLNHFARDHGIPTDPEEALEVAASGTPRPVDVGYLNGRLFVNTSSIGLYVELARLRDRLRPMIGYHLTLGLSAVMVFARMRTLSARIELGGRSRVHRTPLVFVGVDERDLGPAGLGSRKPGGGRGLHVVVVRGRARRRILAVAGATMLKGIREVSRTPRAESELVDELEIDIAKERIAVALDGDIHTLTPPLRYRLAREALNLVGPR